jgi:hypothetical protein
MFLLFIISGLAFAQGFEYKIKYQHKGGDLTPPEAYQMLQDDPEHDLSSRWRLI